MPYHIGRARYDSDFAVARQLHARRFSASWQGRGRASAMSGAVPAGSTLLPMVLFDRADGVREFGSGYPP